jgi:predicted O-linked N-acetylglucosamine transferase (SPINDLY family)
MDYQDFIEHLPGLYENWGQDSVQPKSNQFHRVLEQVQGMTTANVMQLLNFAVERMEPGEVYCEVGCFQGATLIGALLNHPEQMAYAVDNFYEFDLSGDNLEKLKYNLAKFALEEKIFFCNQDFEDFFFTLRDLSIKDKIGVYFYDGAHDYRSQMLGLLLVIPFLAEQALIIVDDSNLSAVQQANWDFIATHPQCKLLLDLPTARNGDCTFWNGIQVLSWDIRQDYNYDGSTFKRVRQQSVIQSMYNLQFQRKQEVPNFLYQAAVNLHQQKQFVKAEQKYQQFLSWDSNNFDAWFNLGMLYYTTEQYEEAQDALFKALEIDASKAVVHYGFGMVLEKMNNTPEAIVAYQQAILLDPTYVDAYNNLGNLLCRETQSTQAEAAYRQAIAANPSHIGSYLNLGNLLFLNSRIDEALKVYEKALEIEPDQPDVLYNLNIARIGKRLELPVLYNAQEEINRYRQQFTLALQDLIQETSLTTPETRKTALTGVCSHVNFYLAYQGCNDLELQNCYGQFVHRIMAANYPEWVKPRPMPPVNDKIRIGYVSVNMRRHTVAKLSLGWLRNCDKHSFEVYSYYLYTSMDDMSQEFERHSDFFYHIPENLEAVCKQIIYDQLHILVFIDIGMHAPTMQIAGLRLAPVQCATWGHPVTSGLPTIDYFLSSDLMEPENAQKHYSEKLFCLPNIGVSYAKPVIPKPTKSRADFQLSEHAVVYLSCQSLQKYLPQYDYIFAEIARRVPQAQFAFLSSDIDSVTEQFRQRLKDAFANFGLNSEDYCVILPRQDQCSYWNLNLISDIFLDTLSWSGGNTTLEAIACNLPIVTCPGKFMRGRHSYGILKMLEITDTIAQSEAEYIEIAVRLGLEPDWRFDIVKRMNDCHDQLYDDKICVTALEAFYKCVVQSGLAALT